MTKQNQALASADLGLAGGVKDLVRNGVSLEAGTSVPICDPILRDDRQLLDELGMSDTDAAAFLGRSRQALHQKLGPKNGTRKGAADDGAAGIRSEYFKVSDVYTLASAALQLGRPFRAGVVLNYMRLRKKKEPEAFALLDALLKKGSKAFDVSGASAILMILPGFADMLVQFEEIDDVLADIVEDAQSKDEPAEVFVVGPTSAQANIAGEWLGVPEERCFGHDSADLLSPTIIVFAARDPRVYSLAETGKFMGAPEFQRATVASRALAMLPAEVRMLASAGRSARLRKRA